MERRLEDRIQKLCRQLLEADQESKEFQRIAAKLRESLAEHISRTRTRLGGYPISNERRTIKN